MNKQTGTHGISVIVPVLNEHENLPKLLTQFGLFSFEQVIFVDGGSTDGSWDFLQKIKEAQKPSETNQLLMVQSEAGRAKQMNAGARQAENQILLFIHADAMMVEGCRQEIEKSLEKNAWGRFDICFQEQDWRMNTVAWFINWRSRITGISTGDQTIFVKRDFFETLGGFTDIALMEDIEFSQRALKFERPYCSKLKVATSARRWLQNGVIRTVLLMWGFRLAYYLGVSPKKLSDRYRQIR